MIDKPAGYSETPLAKKLGIKPGFNVQFIHTPDHYFDLFSDFPSEVEEQTDSPKDFIHFFTKNSSELEEELPKLKDALKPKGMIWVSWPKKASKVPTDITEDLIRDLALKIGLVDIKVCAIDHVWSGLKLVIPVKDRKV